DGAVLLTVRRAPDVADVAEALDLDRAIDGQVRPGATGKLALERDLDSDRPVLHRRVDAHDPPLDHPVARIDPRRLTHRHVAHLRRRDAEHRLEPPRLRDTRDRRPRHDPLPHLERHLLQLAGGSGPDLHRLDLRALEIRDRLEALDLLPLDGELRLDRGGKHLETTTLDPEPHLELRHAPPRVLELHHRYQPLLRQRLMRPDLPQRLLVLAL